MAFAAPVVAETAAAGSTAAAASGAAARTTAGTAGRRKLASTGEPARLGLARRKAEAAEAAAARAQAATQAADEFADTEPDTEPDPQPAPDRQPGAGRAGSDLGSAVGRSVGRSAGRAVNAGGGLLLGAFSYVLALVFLRDGADGVRAWLAAKFLNQVPATTPPAAAVNPFTTMSAGLRVLTGGDR